jgi:hypothetical protein
MNTDRLQAIAAAISVPVAAFFGEGEGSLSPEEQALLTGYRALANPEVRKFVLHCLTK